MDLRHIDHRRRPVPRARCPRTTAPAASPEPPGRPPAEESPADTLDDHPCGRQQEKDPEGIGKEPGGHQQGAAQEDEGPVGHLGRGHLPPGQRGPEPGPGLEPLLFEQPRPCNRDQHQQDERDTEPKLAGHLEDDPELDDRHRQQQQEERPNHVVSM